MEEQDLYGNMNALKTNLENSDFYVQQGSFEEFDTIEMASKGKLLSCFGNNAGSVYTVLFSHRHRIRILQKVMLSVAGMMRKQPYMMIRM